MTDDLHKATRQLIHDIASKDRKFRAAQTIFSLCILGLLLFGLIFGYQTIQKDMKQHDQQMQEVIKEIQKSVDIQSKQLQCIVNFFSKPDRQNFTIQNPNQCFIKKVSDSESIQPSGIVLQPAISPTSNNPQSVKKTSNNNTSNPQNPPKKKPLLCTISLNLLGCR